MPGRWIRGERARYLVILYLFLNAGIAGYGYYALAHETQARLQTDCERRMGAVHLLNEERVGQLKLWARPLEHADPKNPDVIAFKETLQKYFGTPIPPPAC